MQPKDEIIYAELNYGTKLFRIDVIQSGIV